MKTNLRKATAATAGFGFAEMRQATTLPPDVPPSGLARTRLFVQSLRDLPIDKRRDWASGVEQRRGDWSDAQLPQSGI